MGKFSSRNYTKYKNNGDKNKALSIKEYLNEIRIRPYLTPYVHIFHVVLEKLFFRFFVCMEVAKQNLIEKLGKNISSWKHYLYHWGYIFPKRL